MTQGFQYKHGDRPLEGYTIQRAAGRGGFGEVYYTLSDSGREVALKVIQGYEQIELRGISQCMNLKSPHLVTIFDVKYNEQGKPFVVMEYVAGPSLRELIDESPTGLGIQKSGFFLREIGKGLTFLHDRGIVHRDLKPGNIFYEDGYVKIGDYGLSKAISPTQHTGQTVTVGTVHYMAPEIGEGIYDKTIDIYALGVVLYEMLTGQAPFIGSSVGEILMKHVSTEVNTDQIEEHFATVIRRAMAKDPADRYQTMQEMVEAVFGAEHVRQSVSHFRPDSLTMVAQRVAQKAGVGGPGSSAGPVGEVNGAGTAGGRYSDVWERLADGVDRVGERLGQLGRRAARVGSHVGLGSEHPTQAHPASEPADPRRDPLDRRRRHTLGLIATIVIALGAGAFTGPSSALLAFVMIVGTSMGIVLARQHLLPKLTGETDFVQRLAVGGLACVFAGLLSGPIVLVSMIPGYMAGTRHLGGTFIAIFVSLFLLNWIRATSPGREERVSLGLAIKAGAIAFVFAMIFDGVATLAIGVLAGTALVAQVASPFDPQAWLRSARRKRAKPTHPQAAPAAGTPPGQARRYERYLREARPPTLAVRHVRGSVRALWLAGFVGLVTLGLMLLISLGITRYGSEEFAAVVSAGIGTLMFSVFFLVKGCRKTFVSWWGSLVKPVLMLLCVQSVITAGVCLGGMRLDNEEVLFALFFIIFPIILFIVIAAIPSGAFRAVPGRNRAEGQIAGLPGVSPYRRLWALILAGGMFIGVNGLQRFYVGKVGTGLVWLITFGLGGIGQVFDIIMIAMGQFRDSYGRLLVTWQSDDELRRPAKVRRDDYEHRQPVADELDRNHPGPIEPQAPMREQRAAEDVSHTPQTLLPFTMAGLTSWMLASLAVLIMAVGIVIAICCALDLPGMIQAGLFPGLARELERDVFGTPAWPQILHRVGKAVVIIVMLLSAAVLVFARRRAGLAHMLRAVVGTLGLLAALSSLRGALARIDWSTIAERINNNWTGAAIETFLDGVRRNDAILAGVLFLAAIFVLAWPERRATLLPAGQGSQGDGR